MKRFIFLIIFLLILAIALFLYQFIIGYINENKILKQVISRLEAESRIAEVLVTEVRQDQETLKTLTTIKFLEYDSKERPLEPKYFTFKGNIIQFQSLVIRFNDIYIRNNDSLRNRSAYIFWKVFMLDGANTEEFEITKLNQIPQGYKLDGINSSFERKLWSNFWTYALDPKESKKIGIKNAQIEAPGTMFIPGTLYTLKIEHDGGIKIDSQPIPEILKGEHIPK